MNTSPYEISRIPVSSRWSFLFADKGYLEVDGYAVVLRQGVSDLTHLPVGATTCVLIGPGVVVTHEAVKACAAEGTLLLWVGEHGVRCYSAGQPGGASAEHLLLQAGLRLDPQKRLRVARTLYGHMFKEDPPAGRSVDQLRGIEGSRVKKTYKESAHRHGVPWKGRRYDIADFDASDEINKAISVANTTLYALSEAVILALGYSPAIGFIHSGHPRSFAFDLADTIKMETTVEVAFSVVKSQPGNLESAVRLACRDFFATQKIAGRLVSILEEVMVL